MIAVLPGDGIGPEVTAEAVRALKAAAVRTGATLQFVELPFGGRAIDETGVPLPAETLETCRRSHAVLMGAVGGPKWDALAPELRPERGLLGIREGLGTFANLRPVRLPPAMGLTSPLRDDLVAGGFDVLVVRELTGGLYYGDKRRWEEGGVSRAMDVMSYSAPQIERLARVAFALAQSRSGHLTSVDKANVLVTSRLWREVVDAVARDFPDVRLDHMYVDNCAHLLVRDPRRFDVILTENTFGDILSDLGGGLVGSLGLLPSASLGDGGPGLYEPVHGSAPDIAGRGVANPVGAILSAAMLARYSLDREDMAGLIEDAVWRTLAKARPADLVSAVGGPGGGGPSGGRKGGQGGKNGAGAGQTRPVSTQDFGSLVEQAILDDGAEAGAGGAGAKAHHGAKALHGGVINASRHHARVTRNRHGFEWPVAEGRFQW